MSRIGKQPIDIPEGIKVEIKDGLVQVTGPEGVLECKVDLRVKVEQKENQIVISIKNIEDKEQKALWGLTRSLVANMVKGVKEPFEKKLEINGVGYKAEISGDVLKLKVGYSHDIDYKVSKEVKVVVEKNIITITGPNKQKVGQVAAEIRSFRKPEPYKGKGIKYEDEVIRRKVGKAAGKGDE